MNTYTEDMKAIKTDLNDIQNSIKQMLVLSWLNANADRRQDLLTELEAVAASNDIKLIKEVIWAIVEIAQDEQTRNLVSQEYYDKHSVKPVETFTPFMVEDANYHQ